MNIKPNNPKLKQQIEQRKQLASEKRELDCQYIQMREVICNSEFYRTASRHLRIRFDLWGRKLDQIINDLAWKKNRNHYIKLMYLMAESEVVVEPFLSLPPEGELPFLKNYEINAIIDLVQQQINEKIKKYGFCNTCLSEENERNVHYNLQRTELNSSMELDEETEKEHCFEKTGRVVMKEEGDKENKALNYETKTTQEESINGWASGKGKERQGKYEKRRNGAEPLREISFNRERTYQEYNEIPSTEDVQQHIRILPISNSHYFDWKPSSK